jgi:Zn-dependent protease with chaperone function
MIASIVALAVGLIALPHAVGLQRRSAATALVLWTVALGVRAAGCLGLAVYLMVEVPSTAAFAALTNWCVDDVVPALAGHVGMLGHQVGDTLSLAPFVVLNVSALWVAVRIARGARTVRQLLTWSTVGPGPRGTVVLGGRQVMLGAAGFLRPRVVVSAGALTALDDDELAAAIAHERGHIRRGHRFVAAFAELCGALARALPGTRWIVAEVHRQIERDADAWAVGRSHDRVALASAICKSALSRAPAPALALLSGSGAADRVDELLRGPLVDGPAGDRALRLVVLGAAALLLCLAITWVARTSGGGLPQEAVTAFQHACPGCNR